VLTIDDIVCFCHRATSILGLPPVSEPDARFHENSGRSYRRSIAVAILKKRPKAVGDERQLRCKRTSFWRRHIGR
jgi:hypothetical protein